MMHRISSSHELTECEVDSSTECQKRRLPYFCVRGKALLSTMASMFRNFCCRGNKQPHQGYTMRRETLHDKMKSAELVILRDTLKPICLYHEWEKIAGHEDTRLRIFKFLQIDEKAKKKFHQPKPPKVGLLLYGPPHCGKSAMVHATAKFTNSHLIKVSADTFAGRNSREQEELALAVVTLAQKYRPSLVFIEQLDRIFVSEREQEIHLSRAMKIHLIKMLDNLLSSKFENIYLMATAYSPEEVDAEVLSRFQVSIHVPLPSFGQRTSIIKKILEDEPTSDDINLNKLSMMTIGFNAGELQQLCRTAALYRIREFLESNSKIDTKSCGPNTAAKVSKPLIVRPMNMQDLRVALLEVRKQENVRAFSDLKKSARRCSYNTFSTS